MANEFLNKIDRSEEYTKLIDSVNDNNKSVVKTFLYYGADPNLYNKNNNTTALMIAAKEGYLEILYTLLEYNADPNAENDEGNTPLIFASVYNHIRCVQLLLKKMKEIGKINVNHRNNDDISALLYASTTNNGDVCRLLLNEDANVNEQSSDGYTPMMFAAVHKNHQYIKDLIKYNANLYLRNNDGETVFDMEEVDDDIKKYIRTEKYK